MMKEEPRGKVQVEQERHQHGAAGSREEQTHGGSIYSKGSPMSEKTYFVNCTRR